MDDNFQKVIDLMRRNNGTITSRKVADGLNLTIERASRIIRSMRKFRIIEAKCPNPYVSGRGLVWELREGFE